MKRTEKRRKSEMGPDSAGQSGDTQQISGEASADSESVEELVEELVEEGNPLEAGEVYGVENAKDPDVSQVKTREIQEDDIPLEYQNNEE